MGSGPRRIQRQRTKGWRMPEGAVYVGRPTVWGNVNRVGDCDDCGWGEHEGPHHPMTAEDAVAAYRLVEEALVAVEAQVTHPVDIYADLRGHDLACWCPLDQPCHADVLLELVNA